MKRTLIAGLPGGVLPLGLALGLALVSSLTACGAAAQPRPSTSRASGLAQGLLLDAMASHTGLAVAEVIAPDDLLAPVRVELRDTSGLAALVDVRVLPDARSAQERMSTLLPALSSRAIEDLAALGDRAVIDEARTVLAFARANVLIVVRLIAREQGPALDLAGLGAALVLACDASPRLAAGAVPSAHLALPTIDLQPRASLELPLPLGAVAMRVTTDGDGIARRVADGWHVERGAGALEVRVVAVDVLLRVAR